MGLTGLTSVCVVGAVLWVTFLVMAIACSRAAGHADRCADKVAPEPEPPASFDYHEFTLAA